MKIALPFIMLAVIISTLVFIVVDRDIRIKQLESELQEQFYIKECLEHRKGALVKSADGFICEDRT